MACYKFTINNKEFQVSSPNIGGDTPLSAFLNAINKLKVENEESFNSLLKELENPKEDVEIPDSRRSSEIPYLIKSNLAKSGITLHILTQEEWNAKCEEWSRGKVIGVDKNAKSFFLDGEIYTRQEGFSTNDVMHELSHLLLAVMRSKNFKQYQNFIHTFFKHSKVQDIAKNLKAAGTYSTDYDLDFEEEAVVRYMENIFNGTDEYVPTITIDGQEIDTLNFINSNFREVVKDTFGITEFPGMSILFKSLLSDIPKYGSDMFVVRPINSIGYTKLKKQAIEAEQIHALINYYTSQDGGNIIKEGTCQ